jgi:hypothetical protein
MFVPKMLRCGRPHQELTPDSMSWGIKIPVVLQEQKRKAAGFSQPAAARWTQSRPGWVDFPAD